MLVAIRQNRVKGTGVINRYTRPAMGAIWELENKFNIWKEIEVLACEAQAELGKSGITKEEAAWIRAHADFTVERIDEIEKVTNHDVIAFTTNMAEYIDADVPEGTEPPSRWVHYGMTSSDLGDTALSYQITQAIDIILEDIKQLGETCKRRAFEFQETLCVGRTHGIHAEPMTFGMKFGSWAWALKRAQTRMEEARKVAATGAISGAVGMWETSPDTAEHTAAAVVAGAPQTSATWRGTAAPAPWARSARIAARPPHRPPHRPPLRAAPLTATPAATAFAFPRRTEARFCSPAATSCTERWAWALWRPWAAAHPS